MKRLIALSPFVLIIILNTVAIIIQKSGDTTRIMNLILAAAAMISVFILILGYRKKLLSYFSISTSLMILAGIFSVFLLPRIGILFLENIITSLYIALFSAAFFPPLFGFDPFTYEYSKQDHPESVQKMSRFKSINLILNYVWSVLFAADVILSLIVYSDNFILQQIFQNTVPMALLLLIGLPLTLKLPGILISAGAARRHSFQTVKSDSTGSEHSKQKYFEYGKLKTAQIKKILIINASPRSRKYSKSLLMATKFIKGAESAGAGSELVNLKDLTINYCHGCFTCWTKTPGVCIHKDDMPKLLLKVRDADLIVFVTPLYYFSVSAQLKVFMDRLLPNIKPYMVETDGIIHHPGRYEDEGTSGLVVFAAGGFPDVDNNFEGISSIVRNMSTHLPAIRLMAEFFLPAAELLQQPIYRERRKRVEKACFNAGRDAVVKGEISRDYMNTIADSEVDNNTFIDQANLFWKTLGGKKIISQCDSRFLWRTQGMMEHKEFTKRSFMYTPLFCEENIWYLCRSLLNAGQPADKCRVILLSNSNESIALFKQRSAPENKAVIWDYHVVLEAELDGKWNIFDFDSRLEFPMDSVLYWKNTLPSEADIQQNFLPDLRVIPAKDYLSYFHSDRSHMRGVVSPKDFPDLPCITSSQDFGGISLMEYRNMGLALPDNSRVYAFRDFPFWRKTVEQTIPN